MIRINYWNSGDHHKIAVSGHAGHGSSGHDIVCAGVTAISMALFAYLPEVAVIREAQYGSGELLIDCTGGTAARAAFDMAITGLANIAQKYPQNVDIYIASSGG